MHILCIGSGPTTAADIASAAGPFDRVIATNCAATRHRADIQISLHPHKFAREKSAPWFVSFHQIPGVDEVFPWTWHGLDRAGSSGLFAVGYALCRLNASHVTLAGIGLDVAPHEWGGPDWIAAMKFRQTWCAALPLLKGRVTSMSGWTRQLLS